PGAFPLRPWTFINRDQGAGFRAAKSFTRSLVSRAVAPLLGHCQRPLRKPFIGVIEVSESPTRQSIALDVFHSALHFALSLRTVVAAELDFDPIEIHPILEGPIPDDLTVRLVLGLNDRPGIVIKDRLGSSSEMRKGGGVS